MSAKDLTRATQVLSAGGVIAYPTEAVFGLGCDPMCLHAVERILTIKKRSPSKGLILIAATFDQLLPFVKDVEEPIKQKILATWPGPITWLLPVKEHVSKMLYGKHDTIAVRVTNHPVVRSLCDTYNSAIVSTSANISGQEAAITAQQVETMFGDKIDYIVPGDVGKRKSPTEIRDALSGKIIRS